MTRRDGLVRVIESLHAEIAALKANDIDLLERSTHAKVRAIDELAALGAGPVDAEIRSLADEANRLNETCRIYVNLMAANVRRRLGAMTGTAATAYRPVIAAYA